MLLAEQKILATFGLRSLLRRPPGSLRLIVAGATAPAYCSGEMSLVGYDASSSDEDDLVSSELHECYFD